jgi:hypothetical protein
MKYLKVEHYDDLLRLDAKDIKNQVIDYITFMRNKNLSTSTINRHTSALKHFFDMNDIVGIYWLKITTDLRIKDLKPINKCNIYKATVYAGTPQQYYTFTTPEIKEALDDYIQWRKRLGKNYRKLTTL